MRENLEILQLVRDVSASIFPLAQDAMRGLFEETFTEQRFYMPTFTAHNIAPKPISVSLLSRRTPYTNPLRFEKLLSETAGAGYIKPKSNDKYVVSEKGERTIKSINDFFYDYINKVNLFPTDNLEEINRLLEMLVESTAKTELAINAVALEITRSGHPKVASVSLAQVDQYLDDLIAFRDDAHIAAWTPTGVDGHTWEVLSYVWNGEANTAEKLVEKLPFRDYTTEDHAKTLDDLTQRGWIESGKDGYGITEPGKKIREDAEIKTDDNYFAPWQVLSDDELSLLGKMLSDLKETNIKIAEKDKSD